MNIFCIQAEELYQVFYCLMVKCFNFFVYDNCYHFRFFLFFCFEEDIKLPYNSILLKSTHKNKNPFKFFVAITNVGKKWAFK